MFETNNPVLKVMEFLKPEEFYYSAMYLLFSSDRSREKEYETKLKDAFMTADLSPKRFRIENNIIILECSRYEIIKIDGRAENTQSPTFFSTTTPALYAIAAGEAPSKLSPSRLEKIAYIFR